MSDYKIFKGLPSFRPYLSQFPTLFPKETHLLLHKNLNIIKYHLCLTPYLEQAVILSTTNDFMLPSPLYFLNIFSTKNGSTPTIQISLLNIVPTTNGSMPPIPMFLSCQFKYARLVTSDY